MILKNNLYHIVGQSVLADGLVTYSVVLHADSPIYAAHFPGMPVTPGVCLLMLGKELLAEAIGRQLELVEVKNAKFLSVVSPVTDEHVSCVLRKVVEDELRHEVQAQITFNTDTETKAKLSIKCRWS